jgi:hypothetical protein
MLRPNRLTPMSAALDTPIALRARALWPRLRTTLVVASVLFLFFSLGWEASHAVLALRIYGAALLALTAFTLVERWPRRLPRWLARWALQVLMVAAVFPPTMAFFYAQSTPPGDPPFYKVEKRIEGFFGLTMMGMLVAPWVATAAVLRQRDARILQAERARGAAERQALDARLRLLQGQVQPHFLFNTLANVQALVDVGSPQAAPVLAALVAYLRAAVPRLDGEPTRIGQELDMARAYLQLMQLRMPDRLQFSVEAELGTERLHCPPMTLLTLVENAVRHGIDPSLRGGRIEVSVRRAAGRCTARVSDTGVGLQSGSQGLGTGLQSLRERLRLAWGDTAELRLSEVQPQGVAVEVEFPEQR